MPVALHRDLSILLLFIVAMPGHFSEVKEPPSMAEAVKAGTTPRGLGVTDRRDPWWLPTSATAISLLLFIAYATYRGMVNADFRVGPYLSPFYSPDIEEWFGEGTKFGFSPAFLILWIPVFFRVTCYYFRKEYYRAFFLDPPGCAVGESRRHYRGETAFPLIIQNAHRYALYFALLLNAWLWVDAIRSFWYQGRLGIGVGSVVILLDTVLLSFYTLSCHSLRHLVGGRSDCFSCTLGGNLRYGAWRGVSILNLKHGLWGWASLFMVGLADFYVWMVASGRIHDLNTWGETLARS